MASATEVKERLMEYLKELHLPTFRSELRGAGAARGQESLSYEQYLLGAGASGSARSGARTGSSGCCGSRGCRWRRAWRGWT